MSRTPSIAAVVLAACIASDPAGPAGPSGATTADPPPTPSVSTTLGGAAPVLVGWWGGRGTAEGEFVEPSSVELMSDGVVVVAGHEDRVQRFTPDGDLIDLFGSPGPGPGQFDHPHGLAIDRDRGDLIYVGDQENHRLQVFDRDGQFVRQWGDAGFAHIHDVGIDPATGDLFVGDYELDTLRRFRPDGELVETYGGPGTDPGSFEGVWGVSTDSDGNVYVADTFNRRVQKLAGDGTVLDVWPDRGGVPFVKPTGVFVDHRDVVYVCDATAQVVVGFDTAGTVISVWDLSDIVGFRTAPEDIVIDADGRHIYIAEVFQHRVLHLVPGVVPP